MSLWKHLNQMDRIKMIFMKHPELFEGCGFAIVGGICDKPTMYLGTQIPEEKRRAWAAKCQFMGWKRVRGYSNSFDYEATYEEVDFKLQGVERVPELPVNELVVFDPAECPAPTHAVVEPTTTTGSNS